MILGDLIRPYLNTPWGQRALYGAMGLFGLLLLLTVVDTLSWVVDIFKSDEIVATAPTASTGDPMGRIREIPRAHIFGEFNKPGLAGVPQTTLDLKLQGLFVGPTQEQSRVLIAGSDGKGKLYAVGDKLPNGVLVKEILVDGVMLEVEGELEKLMLPTKKLNFGRPPNPLNFQSKP